MRKVHKPTERVVKILNAVSENPDGLSFTEISNETSIAKGTLSPILRTLVDEKMIYLNKEKAKYIIGTQIFKLGSYFKDNMDMINMISHYMEDIVDECNEICQLGLLEERNVLYIEKVEPVRSIKLESNVGKTLPASVTALGKSLLSKYKSDEIRKLYEGIDLPKLTDRTITDIEMLIEQVDEVREEQVSYEYGESNDQVTCMAVPIYHGEDLIFALSVSIPMYRSKKKKNKSIRDTLLKYKYKIEDAIKNYDLPDVFSDK